jgi:phage-related holin
MKRYILSFAAPLVLAFPLSFIAGFFEKYLFSDWEFLRFLILFMLIDLAASWWYHIRQKDFSSKGFSQLFVKIIVYSILLILSHGFASFTVAGESLEPMTWFRTFICTALLVREAISIVEKLNKIKPGIIPSTIVKYLKGFDDNGKFHAPDT